MSDVLPCPECEGAGTDPLLSICGLVIQCGFCGGRGEVGGDHEPGEDAPPMPLAHPDGRDWGGPLDGRGCTRCAGTRVVTAAAGGRSLTMPCPACRPHRIAG